MATAKIEVKKTSEVVLRMSDSQARALTVLLESINDDSYETDEIYEKLYNLVGSEGFIFDHETCSLTLDEDFEEDEDTEEDGDEDV
jgi:hypothetical protein